MSQAELDSLAYSSSDGGKTYSRKLYGFEAIACSYAEQQVFFYHGLSTVQLPRPLTLEELQAAVRVSWIQLRHLAPSIAVETSLSSDGAWMHKYSVPESRAAVEKWADTTLVVHSDEKNIVERQVAIAPHIWRPSMNGPAMKLHIAPENLEAGRWVFAIHGPHANCDGRSSMMLLGQLLSFLQVELAGNGRGTSTLVWGNETSRLTPAAVILTGKFEQILSSPNLTGGPPAPPPVGFVPFMPSPVENSIQTGTTISRKIVLDKEKTRKFRALCKEHGHTVTQVMDSLFAVSQVQHTLETAKASGEDRFKTVVDLYGSATNWLIPLTFKDQRPHMPGYTSLLSPGGTVLFAVDGFSLVLDMAKIRGALKFDMETSICARDGPEFWNGVVQNYTEAARLNKVDIESYLTRQVGFQASLSTFSAEVMKITALASSSIGDFDKLGYFADLKPSVEGKLAVLDVLHAVAANMPIMVGMYWQYDEKLTVFFHSGPTYHTAEDMDRLCAIFTEVRVLRYRLVSLWVKCTVTCDVVSSR